MALVVEDGSGLANTESYVGVTDFKAYADARGLDYSIAADDTAIEQALRRATAFVDTYRAQFPGYRVNQRLQALEWPRVGAYTYVPIDGRDAGFVGRGIYYDPGFSYILSNVIPIEIVQATCEAAVREVAAPGSMQPDRDRGGAIQSLRAGSVEIVYGANASADTTYSVIESILASLLISGVGGGLFGVAARG